MDFCSEKCYHNYFKKIGKDLPSMHKKKSFWFDHVSDYPSFEQFRKAFVVFLKKRALKDIYDDSWSFYCRNNYSLEYQLEQTRAINKVFDTVYGVGKVRWGFIQNHPDEKLQESLYWGPFLTINDLSFILMANSKITVDNFIRTTLKQALLKEISHLSFKRTKATTQKVLKINNHLCQQCNNEKSTYKIHLNRKMMLLCDYCFYYLKYKNKDQKIVVDSHLATKKGVDNRIKAIKKFLLPMIRKKIDKKLANNLWMIHKVKGSEALLTKIKEYPELSKFLAKNNISYYELIKALSLLKLEK